MTVSREAPSSTGVVLFDVESTRLTEADRRRLSHPRAAGVILFTRNFEHRAQLVELVHDIRVVRSDALICVDHEGGRVQRFRTDGFTTLPPVRRLGQLWDRDDAASRVAAIHAATAFGYILGSELRACGIDLSFAPVLDLDWARSSVIGDRAFHGDPRTVMLLAKSLMHGMKVAGLSNCTKHFPGHGWAEADSHVAVPTDPRSLDDILAADAAPYGWLGLVTDAVMPAHVIYPRVDSEPAGFSAVWIQDVLRRRLGFSGAVISDDITMEGARSAGDLTQAANAALRAGCDLLLMCNQPHKVEKVLDGIEGVVSDASAQRIQALRANAPAMPWDTLHASDRFAAAFKAVKAL